MNLSLIHIFAAAIVLIGSFFTSRPRPLRSPCLKIVLALALIPLTVSALKATTHVYCPASLERYGGSKPYVRIWESYPEGQKPSGRCFPAGHASGGFAFLILAFCFRETWKRVLGALCGLALGWTAGWYQMMRGEHFLSHTLATMILAWALCPVSYTHLHTVLSTPGPAMAAQYSGLSSPWSWT